VTFHEIYWSPPLTLRAKWACETGDKKRNTNKTKSDGKKKNYWSL